MENRKRENIYVVAFIGGILCIFTLLTPTIYSMLVLNPAFGLGVVIFALPDVICGIIMVKSGFKMRSGKKTWIQERKKLKISSWFVVSFSLGFAFISLLVAGSFLISFEYGFVGGLIIIFGKYFYKRVNPIFQEGDKFQLSPMKEQQIYANPKFCTKCGFNIEERLFKFCPKCSNQLTSE
ncbi:MAG: hypothetical protein ACTSQU_06025 [Promethearchaeota archaeon]